MHKIINQTTGKTLGYVDKPRYIFLAPSGSYVQCEKEKAQGVAYKSTPYNLFGREPLNAKFDTVLVRETDSGEIISQQENLIKTLTDDLTIANETIITLYEQLANVDEVLISMYEEQEMI